MGSCQVDQHIHCESSRRRKRAEKWLKEILAENFTNLMKDIEGEIYSCEYLHEKTRTISNWQPGFTTQENTKRKKTKTKANRRWWGGTLE